MRDKCSNSLVSLAHRSYVYVCHCESWLNFHCRNLRKVVISTSKDVRHLSYAFQMKAALMTMNYPLSNGDAVNNYNNHTLQPSLALNLSVVQCISAWNSSNIIYIYSPPTWQFFVFNRPSPHTLFITSAASPIWKLFIFI